MKGFARSLPSPGTDPHALWPLMMGNELLGLLRGDAYQGPSAVILEQVTCGNGKPEQLIRDLMIVQACNGCGNDSTK